MKALIVDDDLALVDVMQAQAYLATVIGKDPGLLKGGRQGVREDQIAASVVARLQTSLDNAAKVAPNTDTQQLIESVLATWKAHKMS